MNSEVLYTFGIKIESRDEYAIEYLEEILEKYAELTSLNPSAFVYGKGHRKTIYQRQYEKLNEYKERLLTLQKILMAIFCAQMANVLYLNIINMLKGINTDERKKSMNVKIVQDVLIMKYVAIKKKVTEQQG